MCVWRMVAFVCCRASVYCQVMHQRVTPLNTDWKHEAVKSGMYSPLARRKSLWGDGGFGVLLGECLLPVLHQRVTPLNTDWKHEAACTECTSTVFCMCCDNVLHLITGGLMMLSVCKHMKACCLFGGCGTDAFRMVSSSSLWNLANVHKSNCLQEFSPGQWTVVTLK
jgi:hypothetical protein